MLLSRLLNSHISLPFSNLCTGLRSTNALNITQFSLLGLPTKFLQPVKLAIFTTWSLFNPSQYPLFICCHPFSPTNHLLIENHRSLIQVCITPSLESTSKFIPSASPVLSRFTSSSTCQLIFVISVTLDIHYFLTLSLQVQNVPFRQILPACTPELPSWIMGWTGLIVLMRFRLNFSVCSVWKTKLATVSFHCIIIIIIQPWCSFHCTLIHNNASYRIVSGFDAARDFYKSWTWPVLPGVISEVASNGQKFGRFRKWLHSKFRYDTIVCIKRAVKNWPVPA